jgi:RNA polymerase sigma-70 factor (ECF subfamily)
VTSIAGGAFVSLQTPHLDAEFERVTAPFRRELLALCYRMLGSVQDAEDALQETLLRAWRGYRRFDGRSSVRTWLYRIATNACLRALEQAARRPLPAGLGGPDDDPDAPPGPARTDVAWLQPFPTPRPAESDDPAAIVEGRADLRLALVAALQLLPPRQRVVLILRDVLEWRASEVAGLLDTSSAAVNSLLQRAKAQLGDVPAAASTGDLDAAGRSLLNRYAAAFENGDVAALMGVLTDDAVWEMPPFATWFVGRETIVRFLTHRLPLPGGGRMVPVSANGQPAFALYRGDGGDRWHAHALHVLTVADAGVTAVVAFLDPAVFGPFGLAQSIPAEPR